MNWYNWEQRSPTWLKKFTYQISTWSMIINHAKTAKSRSKSSLRKVLSWNKVAERNVSCFPRFNLHFKYFIIVVTPYRALQSRFYILKFCKLKGSMNLLKWVERKIAFKRLNRLIEKSLYFHKSTSQSQRVAINLWFDDIMVVDIFFKWIKFN